MDNQMILNIPIPPYPKPRMTQSDKWKKRKCVVNYFLWKDSINQAINQELSPAFKIIFTVPMPESWSKKKRAAMIGQPHQQRPDLDNYLKAFLDATLNEDGHIWNVHASKIWGEQGTIRLEEIKA